MLPSPLAVGRPCVPFAAGLRKHGGRSAIVSAGNSLSYDELADRVDELGRALGTDRRLVLLQTGNHLEAVVGYLAALAGGHPVLVAAGDHQEHLDRLIACYDPDVVLGRPDGDLLERRAGSAHDLHEDLALLLSTSGTTGAAKLVRLSHQNLQSNATAIASYLGITTSDRAITSLPLHYCYGLSVLNSHLLAGASVVLTEASVLDPCFWAAVESFGVTSIAGVPHTFELLDRVGLADMDVPTLRYLTQAGGRMPAGAVRRWAEVGEAQGWDLVVMYGQTEATARMAYLPPALAASHPTSIGRPIPGGCFELVPVAGLASEPAEDVGELVYRGPNVMLGYATHPADLALGATVDRLHTGDLARRSADGLFEIVGRTSRFVKLFGLRVDLAQVEQHLADAGWRAACVGSDDELVVAAEVDATDLESVRAGVCAIAGLPRSAVRVIVLDALPRLRNGKPDLAAVSALAASQGDVPASPGSVADLVAQVLGRPEVPLDATFVELGGDSLSYVEMSIRLEERLGALPVDWHRRPIGALAALEGPPRRVPRVETNVVLRAVAILLVVGTHSDAFHLPGGAHLLFAIAGFNFARFQLASGRLARSIARIAVPAMAWMAAAAVLVGDGLGPAHVLLVNGVVGSPGSRWGYWYIEALVHLLVALALLLRIPGVRRLDAARPLAIPLLLLGGGLLLRFDVVALAELHHRTKRPHELVWLFALGWLAARASGPGQRAALSAAVLASVPGFFGQPGREALIALGVLLVVWIPTLPIPRPLNRVTGVVAGASLYVYLTHWQVYPPLLEALGPWAALGGSLAVGVLLGTLGPRAIDALAAGELRRLARRAADLVATARRPRRAAALG